MRVVFLGSWEKSRTWDNLDWERKGFCVTRTLHVDSVVKELGISHANLFFRHWKSLSFPSNERKIFWSYPSYLNKSSWSLSSSSSRILFCLWFFEQEVLVTSALLFLLKNFHFFFFTVLQHCTHRTYSAYLFFSHFSKEDEEAEVTGIQEFLREEQESEEVRQETRRVQETLTFLQSKKLCKCRCNEFWMMTRFQEERERERQRNVFWCRRWCKKGWHSLSLCTE